MAILYTGWASHCDARSYHGWIIAFDAQDLHQVSVFNSTPNANRGAIWMGGAAPAADAEGNIYAVSGNGAFDADQGGTELGDSVIKLSSPGLTLVDHFTPYNQLYLDTADIDLGSSGAILLPDTAGSAAHPHLLVSAGKEGRIYLLDRDPWGDIMRRTTIRSYSRSAERSAPLFGGPAYFNDTLYFAAANDRVKALSISEAHIARSSVLAVSHVIAYPGAVPAISANGSANGIVWLVEAGIGGMLHAYDASNLAIELYNSEMNSARDSPGLLIKFAVPTIANGRVYVGTENSLVVFGLQN